MKVIVEGGCPWCGGWLGDRGEGRKIDARDSKIVLRCENCRKAWMLQVTLWEGPTGPGTASTHGLHGYRNGCRCVVCRAAKNDQKARYRARHRVAVDAQEAR